ncbi:hypothetical protein Dip518_001286 [Parelusimicrobium proximum]|uniref:LOG family protein n=1 Tax=Parelusimicrobium proximum TaxID=3228953 RepID=UPI003D17A535
MKSSKINSYVKAYEDIEFMKKGVMRPVRLQLELLKPEVLLQENGINATIVCFGSARIQEAAVMKKEIKLIEEKLKASPKDEHIKEALKEKKGLLSLSKYYDTAREFGRLVATKGRGKFAVATGGGPGLMEASNRGAFEAGGKSIGFNITLPMEQEPNPYITPNLAFLFHYFAVRKMHLVMRSKAIVVFPGGFGTFDEMFEVLTLVQTGKKDGMPIVLVGKKFWNEVVNVEKLAEYGLISHDNLKAYKIVETAEEAWKVITSYYKMK